jgi:putative SOS response-associated peptidase YedK
LCGRFSLSRRELVEIADWLDAELAAEVAAQYRPRYNVAPTDLHFIARTEGTKRVVVPAKWGFTDGGKPLINARAETASEKPSFRDAFAQRRCVVPADGFFEWRGGQHDRRPLWFHSPDGGLMALAGLWEPGGPGGIPQFTILTTEANALVAPVHDRMPVVLPPACIGEWLAAPRSDLLVPAPDGALIAVEVSNHVNSVQNDDPRCLEPQGSEDQAENPRDRQLKLL